MLASLNPDHVIERANENLDPPLRAPGANGIEDVAGGGTRLLIRNRKFHLDLTNEFRGVLPVHAIVLANFDGHVRRDQIFDSPPTKQVPNLVQRIGWNVCLN